jgi:calnexin
LINPDLYIPDPNEKKPANWVDQAKIPDPDAKKPSWWKDDEPLTIPDPTATMPVDWQPDEPMQIDDGKGGKKSNPKCKKLNCGPWQAPQIQNPKYRMKWTAPMIDNPAYKGEWKPAKVHNPHHFIEAHPHNVPLLAGIGIEIWNHQYVVISLSSFIAISCSFIWKNVFFFLVQIGN